MPHRCCTLRLFVVMLLLLAGRGALGAAVPAGILSGVVSDPSGAKVAGATVHIQTARATGAHARVAISRDVTTGREGRYSVALPPGVYDVTIVAAGFQVYRTTVTLPEQAGAVSVEAKLAIATEAQTVDVAADSTQLSTAETDNKSALAFKASDLEAFSSDDDTFQQQLLALGGAGDPQSPPQIFVDGFSDGRFPPKTTIREIRINSNPYSAQYDARGDTRVEIFTKPGTSTLHGGLSLAGNDDVLNATNPYAGAEPPYHLLILDANANGPLGKKTSWFGGVQYRDQQNNAVVNATTGLDAGGNAVQTIQAVPAPQLNQTYSGRLDRQVTANNSLTVRFEFNQARQTNGGVGSLVLASEGVDSTANTDTLQVADTQVIGSKMVSDTRFQFAHATVAQNSLGSAPTLVVEGAFNGGSSATQTSYDDQNRGELSEYFSRQQGAHFLRAGGRYRFTHEVNSSRANFNGQFTFPSIQAYEQSLTTGVGATQFTLTTGQPAATLLLQDFDVYGEDEWKVRPNLTLDVGFRFESQDAIPDHADPAPRAGVAWGVGQTAKKPAIVVLRSGGGFFYDRFSAGNLLTTLHENGVAQTSDYVTDPAYYCTTLSATCPTQSSLAAVTPTVYRVSPSLHAAYSMVAGLSAERQLGKIGSISLNYAYIRVVHGYQSANVNAPLPGTYNPAVPSSGVRPYGGTQNIYEFQSNGVSNINRLFVNLNLNPTKRLFFWMFANAREQKSDYTSATSFPGNSYDIAADYGRPGAPGERFYTGGNLKLPWGLELNYFVGVTQGTPFNITTGTDLNGDTQYNDRPAFATAPTAASVVYATRYGKFDANPQPGEATIPINYGTGPAFADLDMGAGRSFKFGRRPAGAPLVAVKGPVALPDPRYSLRLSFDAENVLNHVNAGTPVGVLTSPEFGQSISLNSPFSGNSAANRLLLLRAALNF
jgi:hypothetical protein